MPRPLAFLIIGIVICAAVGSALFFFFSRDASPVVSPAAPLEERAPSPEAWGGEPTAREVAMRAAVAWQADAMLATVQSDDTGEATPREDAWTFLFVSASVPGKGYRVQVAGQRVTEAAEIDYVASGAAFPQSFLTAAEAVEALHRLPGYEQAEVLGVEAVYGSSNATWYWGVKTPRGTVSIEATKK
ncbi:MAG: hypothetical protein RL141_1070 [Candidatus Parcubacteria bacterium]|jgi:hypothetical protein